MKLRHIFCLGVLAVGLLGCDKTPEELQQSNLNSLKNPEYIGVLPNGKKIKRVKIYNTHANHYVYFIDNSENVEVTVNYPVRVGKVTRNEVIVLIDGIPVSTNIIDK